MGAARLVVITVAVGMMAHSATAQLVGSEWKAVELAGMTVPPFPSNRYPHLVFDASGRVSGSDGCNRLTGSYTLKGEALTFSQIAGTRMACPDTAEVERRFNGALMGTSHWRFIGNQLQFFGATGKPLAVFERGTPIASTTPASSRLAGTSWRLVKFEGGDGKTLRPDTPDKYTFEFYTGGRVTLRVDCNRGSATWKSPEPGQLELGPLALTRMKCPAGSMHDQIVRQWTFVRSFVIENGHLFLSLMADGGIYEFEPRGSKK